MAGVGGGEGNRYGSANVRERCVGVARLWWERAYGGGELEGEGREGGVEMGLEGADENDGGLVSAWYEGTEGGEGRRRGGCSCE